MTSGQAKSRRSPLQRRQSLFRLALRVPSLLAAALFLLAATVPSMAQTLPLGPRFVLPYQTVVDSTGTPVPGALLYFYASGTNTPLTTYSDALLTVPNPNPVKANAAGVFPNIFMLGNYKVVLTDSLGNQLWTADPDSGASDFYNPVFIGGNAMTFPGVASSIAPLASPTFTGTITTPDAGTWGSLGINGTAIGGVTPGSGAFTTLAASGAVSGAGFSAYLASPPAIGGTAPAPGAFTNFGWTGTASGKAVRANSALTVASPTAPNSTSAFKMQGLAGSITPSSSGNVLVDILATVNSAVTTAGYGLQCQISYGTGTAPTSNATLAGTQVGAIRPYTNSASVTAADVNGALTLSWVLTGLTLSTPYWLDLACESIGAASDASLINVSIVAFEQ